MTCILKAWWQKQFQWWQTPQRKLHTRSQCQCSQLQSNHHSQYDSQKQWGQSKTQIMIMKRFSKIYYPLRAKRVLEVAILAWRKNTPLSIHSWYNMKYWRNWWHIVSAQNRLSLRLLRVRTENRLCTWIELKDWTSKSFKQSKRSSQHLPPSSEPDCRPYPLQSCWLLRGRQLIFPGLRCESKSRDVVERRVLRGLGRGNDLEGENDPGWSWKETGPVRAGS